MQKTSMHLVLCLVACTLFCILYSSLELVACLGGASGGEFGSLMGGRKRERKEEAEVFKSIKISFLSRMVAFYGDCVIQRLVECLPLNQQVSPYWTNGVLLRMYCGLFAC